jgi:hypothetical protein
VLTGQAILFGNDAPDVDLVLSVLIQPSDALDMMTKQALELLFSSFQLVSARQLIDYLSGGSLINPITSNAG